jgi:protocatechuate 3,4-dioxygenase beta subunit
MHSMDSGLTFVLDVGLMDITTCQPLANTMVEIWSRMCCSFSTRITLVISYSHVANAMGNYGSFLRGATTSNSGGIAEFQTIFPGWSDGANHVNVAVHTSSSMSSSTTHVGKLYFTDQWTNLIGGTSPYTQNTHSRSLNDDDSDYKNAFSKGYSPVIS